MLGIGLRSVKEGLPEVSGLARRMEQLLRRHGVATEGARLLDFGCGEGRLYRAFKSLGYGAYGCDFASELDPDGDRLRLIEDPYRLPFDDETFDLVVSSQV